MCKQIVRKLRSLPWLLATFSTGLGLLILGIPLMATATLAADESLTPNGRAVIPVSYTHLTLPTIYSV